jgi:hypothetical protein
VIPKRHVRRVAVRLNNSVAMKPVVQMSMIQSKAELYRAALRSRVRGDRPSDSSRPHLIREIRRHLTSPNDLFPLELPPGPLERSRES